ncbi:MAG: prepilin-type N-terminal cleavage/methylation domain-containing protein [Candidatus Saccharibacteria bacterium]|nr:prepilin-type N-terminal cleavage/methylation domain-containing protein [Candidatus Saccharibacteria bacterium]
MHKQYGFTIIELIIVIVVIAILGTIGTLAWTSSLKNARDNKIRSDIGILRSAIDKYYADNGEYPKPTGCSHSGTEVATCNNGELAQLLIPKYTQEIPKDSKGRHYSYAVDNHPHISAYGFRVYHDGNTYCKVGRNMPSGWYDGAPICSF